MKRIAMGALALMLSASVTLTAHANTNDGFIRPETRIQGCIAIVDKVRDGTISPTEWLEQNKEEFDDLRRELKSRNYPAAKAKDMMMGMAITLCMEHKVPGYVNTCVTARDGEKRDIQIMRTAHIAECWGKRVAEPIPPTPRPDEPDFQIEIRPDPQRRTPPAIILSAADQAMLNEDLAIVKQPVVIRGDHENGAKEARLSHCGSYWNAELHYNRSQEARNLLWAVRVWRCMYRTGYTVFTQRCPGVTLVATQGWGPALHELQRPFCYARFAG